MSAEPQRPSDAPRRATGDIPLSWAMPAEVVTAAVAVPKSPVSLALVAAALIVVAIGGFVVTRLMGAPVADDVVVDEPSVAPTVPNVPVFAAAPAIAPVPVPPPSVLPVAVAEAANDDAGRERAKQLVARARRLAKDGNIAGARRVAEDAVVADPGCADCWKTVSLLRKKSGDKAGATLAKARADALATEQ